MLIGEIGLLLLVLEVRPRTSFTSRTQPFRSCDLWSPQVRFVQGYFAHEKTPPLGTLQ